MSEIKRMDIKEFREQGFLQEANRLFFHPLGLALEIIVSKDGSTPERLGGVWDYRDDPEGMVFNDAPDDDKAYNVESVRLSHVAARTALLGDVVQKTGQPCPTPSDGG